MSGYSDKIEVSVVQPPLEESASDFCACNFSCDYVEKAFAGSTTRESDSSSFLYTKFRSADTIVIEIHREGRKVATVTDNTYGNYYSTFAVQPLYVGFVADWTLIHSAFGGGMFEIVAVKTILGQTTTDRGRKFALNTFDEFSANNTVKIEIRQNGNVISSPFDHTGLLVDGWYSAYRIPANFGKKSPSLATDSYESSDRTQLSVQPSVTNEYSLRTYLLPSYIADILSADVPLSDSILISDYALLTPRQYNQLPVFPISVEMTLEANNKEVFECVFTDLKNNTLKQY